MRKPALAVVQHLMRAALCLGLVLIADPGLGLASGGEDRPTETVTVGDVELGRAWEVVPSHQPQRRFGPNAAQVAIRGMGTDGNGIDEVFLQDEDGRLYVVPGSPSFTGSQTGRNALLGAALLRQEGSLAGIDRVREFDTVAMGGRQFVVVHVDDERNTFEDGFWGPNATEFLVGGIVVSTVTALATFGIANAWHPGGWAALGLAAGVAVVGAVVGWAGPRVVAGIKAVLANRRWDSIRGVIGDPSYAGGSSGTGSR